MYAYNMPQAKCFPRLLKVYKGKQKRLSYPERRFNKNFILFWVQVPNYSSSNGGGPTGPDLTRLMPIT